MSEQIWLPYCGGAPQPAELFARWNLDPILLAILLLAAALGLVRTAKYPRERTRFAAAIAVVLLLFVSPLCALTSALFAARSAHHVLLTTLMAFLLAASVPRQRLATLPGSLSVWTALSAFALWAWHAPPLYAAALSNDLVYWAMQISLLATATGFWASVRWAAPGGAIVALLTYMVQMGLLGALLSFSTSAFYAPHALTTAAWGMSPLEDQQLGGIIMWVPGAAAYLIAALARMHELLGEEREPARA